MRKEVTPEIRREILQVTGLCLNPNCTAHDAIVVRIWEYAHKEDITVVRERTIKEILEKV